MRKGGEYRKGERGGREFLWREAKSYPLRHAEKKERYPELGKKGLRRGSRRKERGSRLASCEQKRENHHSAEIERRSATLARAMLGEREGGSFIMGRTCISPAKGGVVGVCLVFGLFQRKEGPARRAMESPCRKAQKKMTLAPYRSAKKDGFRKKKGKRAETDIAPKRKESACVLPPVREREGGFLRSKGGEKGADIPHSGKGWH